MITLNCSDLSGVAEQRVDLLINNAGLLQNSRAVTQDGFEVHLAVNYLGIASLSPGSQLFVACCFLWSQCVY